MSKGSHVPEYTSLKTRSYFYYLNLEEARKVFQIRTETYDIKTFRSYMYGDDTTCRLCKNATEDIEHIMNECTEIERCNNKRVVVGDEEKENIQTMVSRIKCYELRRKAIEN